jgi:hypothetical protein
MLMRVWRVAVAAFVLNRAYQERRGVAGEAANEWDPQFHAS